MRNNKSSELTKNSEKQKTKRSSGWVKTTMLAIA
jgi:hypothetical protein